MAQALPARLHPQHGANCREAAVGNLLRCAEPTAATLRPFMIQFMQEHFPREAQGVANEPQATLWTMAGDGGVCLMTYVIEAHARDHVALLVTPQTYSAMARALGEDPATLLQQDRGSLGMLYFDAKHCMSVLQDASGQWWDVPQAHATPVAPSVLATKMQRSVGCVLTFSAAFARHTILPRMRVAADPLLAARWGARLMDPLFASPNAALWIALRATPSPRRRAADVAALVRQAQSWLALAAG